MTKNELQQAYLERVLADNKKPTSVHQFAKALDIAENEFYEHFGSLKAVQRNIWAGFFDTTISRMEADEVYADYTAREKMLAFFYTLQEVLKEQRSYLQLTTKTSGLNLIFSDSALSKFKEKYIEFAAALVQEGVANQEVMPRLFLASQYGKWLWPQTNLVIKYWLKDESEQFARTDELIEKAVHFSFDLMGRTPLDSAVDLAVFLVRK